MYFFDFFQLIDEDCGVFEIRFKFLYNGLELVVGILCYRLGGTVYGIGDWSSWDIFFVNMR